MQLAAEAWEQPAQVKKIEASVRFAEKARCAVVSALHDMHGLSCEDDPRATGHGSSTGPALGR